MINRPPTRVELKLEDDLADYEETVQIRKRNLQNNAYNNFLYTQNSSSPQESYKDSQQIGHLNFNNSEKTCRNFNLEFSSGALASPNPHSYNKNLNITKQNIISEFISEEGNEDQQEEELKFYDSDKYTPYTPGSNSNAQNMSNIQSPPDFTMK